MPHFAANLTLMFTESPLIERFSAAKAAGFDTVEVLFPYDESAADLLDRIVGNHLTLALINCPPPNYTDGPRGFAAIPGGQARFQHDFKRSLRYARALGAKHLHVMAGVAAGPRGQGCLHRESGVGRRTGPWPKPDHRANQSARYAGLFSE